MATEYSFDETTWFEEKPSEEEFWERRVFTRERLRMAAGEGAGEMEKNESRDHRVGDTGDTEPAALLLEETPVKPEYHECRSKEGHEGAVERESMYVPTTTSQPIPSGNCVCCGGALYHNMVHSCPTGFVNPRTVPSGVPNFTAPSQVPAFTFTNQMVACLRGEHERESNSGRLTGFRVEYVCEHCRVVFVPR